MNATGPGVMSNDHWRRLRPLYLLALLCLAPVVASYLAYYVFPPGGRTNYGDLIEPQRPALSLAVRDLDASPFDLMALRGKWVMLTVDRAECGDDCRDRLWKMRQIRTATGKERERVERVLLITDDGAAATLLLREYEGTRFLRASPAELKRLLVLPSDEKARIEDHVWLIDPVGNLMLRWPARADPSRMKRDLDRLLRASRLG
jgi:hypothetical protein